MSVKARHQHPIASRHPFPEGTFRWERPDSAGVTQEHLRGPETGGFPGVAPVFCPDPPYGSGWGSGFAVWPMNTGVVLYGKCDGGCDTGPRPVTGCHGILRLAGGSSYRHLLPRQTIPALFRLVPVHPLDHVRAVLDVRFRSPRSLILGGPRSSFRALGSRRLVRRGAGARCRGTGRLGDVLTAGGREVGDLPMVARTD